MRSTASPSRHRLGLAGFRCVSLGILAIMVTGACGACGGEGVGRPDSDAELEAGPDAASAEDEGHVDGGDAGRDAASDGGGDASADAGDGDPDSGSDADSGSPDAATGVDAMSDGGQDGGADPSDAGASSDAGTSADAGGSDAGTSDGGGPLGPLFTTVIATDLEHPWAVALLPDGSFLVTERPGRLRIVSPRGAVSSPVAGLPPNIEGTGQGGLLDVVLDPGFARNRRIFLSFAEAGAGGNSTAVARAVLNVASNALEGTEVIFSQQPKVSGTGHYGSRLVVSADGQHLFITTGDRQLGDERSQRTDNEIGKVLRIRLDGEVPTDNPFASERGGERIWSLGHRNIQGAALHPETGVLWTHEHGPQGGDEVNVTTRGSNFGWPVVSYGCPYGSSPCDPIGGGLHAPRFVEPVASWGIPSIAPSGMVFYRGERIPEWQGKILVGALAGTNLWVIDPVPDATRICLPAASRRHCTDVPIVSALGERIRDVREGPDGWVYLLTDSPQGRLIRIER